MIAKLAAAVALTASIGSAAYATPVNLVQNGNFETSSYTSNDQFGTGYGGQGVNSWSGNGGYNLYFLAGTSTTVSANSQYSASGGAEKLWAVNTDPAGGNFVALDGDPTVGGGGGMSQQVSGLTVGDHYALTFSWGAGQLQSRNGNTTEQLQATLGGQKFLTNTVANPAQGFTGWFTTTFNYTATASSELLSFLSIGTPSGLPPIATLDGVSLVDVPEPGSIGLMALGLGVVGLCFMRRRSTMNAA